MNTMQRPPTKLVGPVDLFTSLMLLDFDQRDVAPALLRALEPSPRRLLRAELRAELLPRILERLFD